eukprot:403331192
MVLEYQEGGTLLNKLGPQRKLIERDLQTIMAQLLLAIDFMHQRNIVHRDLKLENVLLNSIEEGEFEIRIADYGLACEILPGTLNYQKCGTPSYIAPEVLDGTGYTTKSDLFGVGSIMYNLITGKFLFHSNNVKDLLILNRECNLQHVSEHIKDISDLGRDLLIKLLYKNPNQRLNAKQALQHPWFSADQQVLQQALYLNAWLCSDKIQRKSAITSQMFIEQQNSQQLVVEAPDDDDDFSHEKGPNGKSKDSMSSFLKIESFNHYKRSLSNNSGFMSLGGKSENGSINYYEMLKTHRRSISQKPSASQKNIQSLQSQRQNMSKRNSSNNEYN